jgi:hypothetical protein
VGGGFDSVGPLSAGYVAAFDIGAPPTASISSPTPGATYTRDQTVLASYSCADPDGAADVASCSGPVPPGSPIDTSTTGMHVFTVSATDQAGQGGIRTVTYTVADGIVPPPAGVAPKCTLKPSGSRVTKKAKPLRGLLKLTVRCNPSGTATLTGTVTQTFKKKKGHKKRKPKRYTITPLTRTALAGKPLVLTVRLPAAAFTALLKGATEGAKFKVSAKNAFGTGTATATIARLTLPKPKR